jgi:glycogen debranching enzyme
VDQEPSRIALIGELLLDDGSYGGAFGPAGVHRSEPTFDPSRYWRGPAWPQLSYLLWLAQVRGGNVGVAAALGDRLVRGAAESGLAEYWNPEDGAGLGAVPQSWAGVCLLVTDGQ